VALAQALVHQPKLLILDEPTSGLDPIGRRQMRDLVLAERAKGTTILLCSHIIPDVEALCDRVVVLVGGKRIQEGSVHDLLSKQVPVMEMAVEGLTLERFAGLGVPTQAADMVAGRIVAKVADNESQKLLSAVLGAGGRVARLQPARFSLEDLFLSVVHDAGKHTVGGEIQ
jgi:ABC-2 type transport system ATP-binding protein